MEKSLAVKNCWLNCWVVPWASSSPKSFQEDHHHIQYPNVAEHPFLENNSIQLYSNGRLSRLPTFSHSSGRQLPELPGPTQSWAFCLQVTPGWCSLFNCCQEFFIKHGEDGYGGEIRPGLKQVWALQTEEAVQSSECFEWNEILSSGVCACLTFIFKLVLLPIFHTPFGNTLKMFWLEQFRTEFF